MTLKQQRAAGNELVGLLVLAAGYGVNELATTLRLISDAQVLVAIAAIAETHARSTAGGVRFVPEEGIAELVLDGADENGFAGALEVADAFTSNAARAALGNLAVAVCRQRDHEAAAADAASEN